jgi:hypothetical protein
MTSFDLLITGSIIVCSIAIPAVMQKSALTRAERRWVVYGWFAHVLASIGFMAIVFNVYGSGDLFVYHRHGGAIADAIMQQPEVYFPMSVEVFLQRSTPMDGLLYADGSTASMTAVAAWVFLFTGKSLSGACMFLAMLVFMSRIAMYSAFRVHFPTHRGRAVLAMALFGVPSALFWTGGVVKEAVACVGLGWLIWGAYSALLHGRYLRSAGPIILGCLVLAMIKAYVLIAFVLGISAFYVLGRAGRQGLDFSKLFSVKNILMSLVFLVIGFYVISIMAPRFAFDKLGEEAAKLQAYGGTGMGDSDYSIGDKNATTLSAQSVFFPIALLTSLFRPLFFEVHNITAALSGVEMLLIQVLILRTWRRAGWRSVATRLLSNPTLSFCAVFVLVFGVGIGLSTTNMGTLSRYRAPMMPFYLLLILSLALPYTAASVSKRPAARR